MTDDTAVNPDERLAAAGDAHHSAITRLLDELRSRADAARVAQEAAKAASLAKEEAERLKAEAVDDKNRISAYLEAVTQNINTQIDDIVGAGTAQLETRFASDGIASRTPVAA